jgi:hypothetical protein
MYKSAAFSRGVLEFIGCIGSRLLVYMFLKGRTGALNV